MTYEDPFASATAETPAEPAQAPVETKTAAVNTAVQADGKVVVTLKGGRDYDAPWIVIHASDVDDAISTLAGAESLKELFDRSQSAAKYFAGLGGSAPAQSGGGGQPTRRAPQGAQEAPEWAPPKPYDDFVYKTGVTKSGRNAGKAWHAWMPPQRDDPQGREAEFFNKP